MSARRAAFSLVELLVVIGIIAILLGLLMPTLSMIREHARQAQCAAQLRSLGQGLRNYAANNRGWYPPCSEWQVYGGDGTGEDSEGLGWTEILAPYYAKPNSRVYNCPDFPPETQINYFLSRKWLGSQNRFALQESDIKLASEFVLSGDCTHARAYPPPFGDAQLYVDTQDCDKDDIRWKSLSFFGEEYGRNAHRAGNNVLFGDDHVACFKHFDPSYMTYHPHKPAVDWEQVGSP